MVVLFVGPVATATARAHGGAGEDREAAPDAVPHAHQPGAAGVRLPGVRHAARDPLHGRYVTSPPPPRCSRSPTWQVRDPPPPMYMTTTPHLTHKWDIECTMYRFRGHQDI